MKKIALIIAMAILVGVSSFAQNAEKNEEKWSDMDYFNVPVLKVLEAREGYLVIYQKNGTGTGQTVIPKKWAKGSEEAPRKLKFRRTTGTIKPYMSVIKKNGEFLRVILTMPVSRTANVWGVMEYNSESLEGTDKETLEDLPLF